MFLSILALNILAYLKWLFIVCRAVIGWKMLFPYIEAELLVGSPPALVLDRFRRWVAFTNILLEAGTSGACSICPAVVSWGSTLEYLLVLLNSEILSCPRVVSKIFNTSRLLLESISSLSCLGLKWGLLNVFACWHSFPERLARQKSYLVLPTPTFLVRDLNFNPELPVTKFFSSTSSWLD